jgi:hypothetical protein
VISLPRPSQNHRHRAVGGSEMCFSLINILLIALQILLEVLLLLLLLPPPFLFI